MGRSTNPRFVRWIISLSVLWVLLGAVAGVFLAEASLRPPRRRVHPNDEQGAAALAAKNGASMQSVALTASDNAVLQAWYFRAGPSTRNHGHAVILLHGVSDSRLGVVSIAPMFLSHGYSVLVPDARAHGESGGDVATYGVRERDDLRAWAR